MNQRRALAAAFALAALVVVLYAPVRGFDFVVYDDGEFVHENPLVLDGLTAEGILGAFTSLHAAYWIPMTWLSYMADVSLSGTGPAGFHVTNALLHAANAALLLFVLWRLTGALGRSTFVAALFALHPLRVESVAWVTERKDVLSSFFMLLALAAYLRLQRRQGRRRDLSVPGCMVLGLMAKPMPVTLPALLLLLDFWPLGRARCAADLPRLIREKVPLLVLSATFGALTIFTQHHAGALVPPLELPPIVRVALSATSYFTYLGKMLLPAGLVIEGIPVPPPQWQWCLVSGAALVGVSLFVGARAGRAPWLAVGWYWYLIALFPVSGILLAGNQWLADRFTYLPQIGLGLALAWGVGGFLHRHPPLRRIGPPLAAACLLVLGALSRIQLMYWRDSEALLTHSVAQARDNYHAQMLLGEFYLREGRLAQAVELLRAAVAVVPDHPLALVQLGSALGRTGDLKESERLLRAARELTPRSPLPHMHLGITLAELGDLPGSDQSFETALRLKPDDPDAHFNFAISLSRQGRADEARLHLARAMRLDPRKVKFRLADAKFSLEAGRAADAERSLREALALDPRSGEAHFLLGRIASDTGRTGEAIEHLQRALALDPVAGAVVHAPLGIALERAGRADEAILHLRRAVAFDPQNRTAAEHLAALLRARTLPRVVDAPPR